MKLATRDLLEYALLGLKARHEEVEQRIEMLKVMIDGRKPGRPRGIPVSAATRRRMSQAQKRRAAEKSKTEWAQKRAAKHSAHRRFSAEARRRMSLAQKRRFANLRKEEVSPVE